MTGRTSIRILFHKPLMRIDVGEPYFRVRQYLDSLARLGHTADLLDFGRLPRGTRRQLLGIARQFAASARAFSRYDVIFVTPHPLVSAYVLLAKILKRRVVVDQIMTYVSHQEVFRRFPRALDVLTYRLADGILTHSETMRDELISTFRVDPNRVKVVYPVLDLELFSPRYESEAGKLRQALGIADRFVVMYHGMWHPWHGLPYIYEAARLLENHRRIVFVIIPRDGEPNRKNVLFVEEQPFERLPVHLQMGDVWCSGFDSDARGERAFSSTLIQAMALGLPVITGRAGERARVLRDGAEARLVPIRDPRAIAEAVLELAAKPEVARAMGARARAFALERFSIDRLDHALSGLLAQIG